MLALTGGILGVLLAYLVVPLRTLGQEHPEGRGDPLDWRVVAFTVFVTVLTGMLFSLAPAWHRRAAAWARS